MAIFKCKMCGGNLDVQDGVTVCECEYCGTQQTVPAADNEKKVNLFNRANRLRINSEFDKAAGVYESIVAEFPEEAEAYWGLCLCSYGIEYVDDPATGRKIPTCHRTSYDSIFQNSNFDMACEYADGVARQVYRAEAKEIDRLQKEILDIANNEEPFDVFICYKETAPDGQRTKDSVLAQDIYDALTAKDYKVFFSRITLEDKLGQDYEPYIFSALNSARVMLAIGTDYEHFNAVWVKNEWSRFLALMSKDKSKTLIPCYCDIDAYDMPEEFKHLQGQDMGKVGFVQDLVRGVEKIIPKEIKNNRSENAASAPKRVVATADSLLERVFDDYLLNKHWDQAYNTCERVLDSDPKNARAFLGKLMAELGVSNEKNLIKCEKNFEINENFRNAIKYASGKEKEKYQTLLYDNFEVKGKAYFENQQFDKAKKYLKRISGKKNYPDAEEMVKKCDEEMNHRMEGIERFKDVYRKYDVTISTEHAYEAQQYIDEYNYMSRKYKRFFPEERCQSVWSIWFFGAGIGMLIILILLMCGSSYKPKVNDAVTMCIGILNLSLIITGIFGLRKTNADGFDFFILFIVMVVVDILYGIFLSNILPISLTYGMMFSIITAPILLFLSIRSMCITKKYSTKLKNLNDMLDTCEQALESNLETEYSAIHEKYPSINKDWMIAMQDHAKETYKKL